MFKKWFFSNCNFIAGILGISFDHEEIQQMDFFKELMTLCDKHSITIENDDGMWGNTGGYRFKTKDDKFLHVFYDGKFISYTDSITGINYRVDTSTPTSPPPASEGWVRVTAEDCEEDEYDEIERLKADIKRLKTHIESADTEHGLMSIVIYQLKTKLKNIVIECENIITHNIEYLIRDGLLARIGDDPRGTAVKATYELEALIDKFAAVRAECDK